MSAPKDELNWYLPDEVSARSSYSRTLNAYVALIKNYTGLKKLRVNIYGFKFTAKRLIETLVALFPKIQFVFFEIEGAAA